MTTRYLALLALVAACAPPDPFPLPEGPPGPQAVSLLGDSLTPPPPSDSVAMMQRAQLDSAHAAVVASPEDPDAWIWLGRRLAYPGYYRDAIAAYTEAMMRFPEDPRLYRHRGHRWITVRQLDSAVYDLAGAAQFAYDLPDEVEPDGQPNARGIPTSTRDFNIWYHLGLAHYLRGDFARALSSYLECRDASGNPDALVATSHWLYMTYRRMDSTAAATRVLEGITPDMEIIENDAYHRLLLMYKGATTPEALLEEASGADGIQNATIGYGVGNWWLYNGDTARAMDLFREIVQGPQWAAFGAIAAEAELARAP